MENNKVDYESYLNGYKEIDKQIKDLDLETRASELEKEIADLEKRIEEKGREYFDSDNKGKSMRLFEKATEKEMEQISNKDATLMDIRANHVEDKEVRHQEIEELKKHKENILNNVTKEMNSKREEILKEFLAEESVLRNKYDDLNKKLSFVKNSKAKEDVALKRNLIDNMKELKKEMLKQKSENKEKIKKFDKEYEDFLEKIGEIEGRKLKLPGQETEETKQDTINDSDVKKSKAITVDQKEQEKNITDNKEVKNDEKLKKSQTIWKDESEKEHYEKLANELMQQAKRERAEEQQDIVADIDGTKETTMNARDQERKEIEQEKNANAKSNIAKESEKVEIDEEITTEKSEEDKTKVTIFQKIKEFFKKITDKIKGGIKRLVSGAKIKEIEAGENSIPSEEELEQAEKSLLERKAKLRDRALNDLKIDSKTKAKIDKVTENINRVNEEVIDLENHEEEQKEMGKE